MNPMMRSLGGVLLGAVLCLLAGRGYGQDARLQLDSLNKLSDKAAHVTDVTLDGPLLQLATRLIESDEGDEDVAELKPVIKNLKGIYVKSFEFDEASQYSKSDVDAIRSQISSRWTKIVQSVDKRTNEHNEIYLLKSGEQVAGILILVAEPRELTVVNIVGNVPVEKIVALEHHFVAGQKETARNKRQNKGARHEDEK